MNISVGSTTKPGIAGSRHSWTIKHHKTSSNIQTIGNNTHQRTSTSTFRMLHISIYARYRICTAHACTGGRERMNRLGREVDELDTHPESHGNERVALCACVWSVGTSVARMHLALDFSV